jgi:hypothetical protein
MPWQGTDLGGAYGHPGGECITKRSSFPSHTRLLAWVIEHNSHGLIFDTLVFLPEGEEPETKEEWRRMPWLDQPLINAQLLAERDAEINRLRVRVKQLDVAVSTLSKDSRANSERALQLRQEREAVKVQRDEARAQFDGAFASMQAAHSCEQIFRKERDEARTQRDALAEELKVLCACIESRNHIQPQDYSLGLADERIRVDGLLAQVEGAISSWVAVSLPGPYYELLERIRSYRKGTEAMRKARIKQGQYPGEPKS